MVYIGHIKAEQDSRTLLKILTRLCKDFKSHNSLIIKQHWYFYISKKREVKKQNNDVDRLLEQYILKHVQKERRNVIFRAWKCILVNSWRPLLLTLQREMASYHAAVFSLCPPPLHPMCKKAFLLSEDHVYKHWEQTGEVNSLRHVHSSA